MMSTSGFIVSSRGSSTYIWWKVMLNVIGFITVEIKGVSISRTVSHLIVLENALNIP